MAQHYVFGYGTLISSESRAYTVGEGTGKEILIPVRVSGIERAWNLQITRLGKDYQGVSHGNGTILGIVENDSAVCNGILIEVSQDALRELDKREAEYNRVEVLLSKITILTDQTFPSDASIWVYFPKDLPSPVNDEYPLIQSYIDVILTGCLIEYGEEFAIELIQSTTGWDGGSWIDDRYCPRYTRLLQDTSCLSEIDALLERYVPSAFALR